MSIFTDRLAELIESKGITKKEFAEAIGVTPPQVTYYLGNREPSYDKLVEIATYFDVSTDYLTGKDNHKAPVDMAVSEYLKDVIDKSEGINELLEKFPIDEAVENYLRGLLNAVHIDIPEFDTGDLFKCVQIFNDMLSRCSILNQKWNEGNYDMVLDELKKIINFASMIRGLMGNNAIGIIKNVYENDSIEQEIRERIETNTAYRIKHKPNKKTEDEFLKEKPDTGTDLI